MIHETPSLCKTGRRFTVPMVCLLAALVASAASAQSFEWLGGDGDWNTAALWNLKGIPGYLDDVQVISSDLADWRVHIVPQVDTFGFPSNPWQVVLNSLVVDATKTGQATVQQDAYLYGIDTGGGASVVSVGQLIIGNYGSGEYVLNGGHLQVTSRLAIAQNGPSQGVTDPARWATLRVVGGTLAFSDHTFPEIGGDRNGRVIQTGGYVDGMNLGGSGSQLTNNVMQVGMSTQYNGAYEGRYEISGGRLDMTTIQVGDGGRGAFVHTGGEVNSYNLIVGYRNTAFGNGFGSYNLSGPDAMLNTRFGLPVQVTDIGTFEMNGGTFVGSGIGTSAGGSFEMTAGLIDFYDTSGFGVNGSFSLSGLGTHSGGQIYTSSFTLSGKGIYNLSGGLVDAQSPSGKVVVGALAGDTAFLNQTGGSVHAASEAVIGEDPGSDNQWFFGGGSITTPRLVAGDEGKGTFNHSNATLNGVDDIVLGRTATADGLYVMTGSSAQLTSATTTVADAGTGRFRHFDGIHTTDTLTLGKQAGSSGLYEQSGGFVNVIGSNTTIVGRAGTGDYHQTGGTHSTFALAIGSLVGASGVYTFEGDDLNVIGSVDVGLAGTGVFHQNADGVSITDDLRLGRFASGNGTYNLNAGSLSVDNLSVGVAGTGAFTAENGTQLTVSQTLDVATAPGSVGTLTLKDTTLNANDVHIAGQARFGPSAALAVDAQITGTLTLDGDEPAGDRRGLLDIDYGQLKTNAVIIGDANFGQLDNFIATHLSTGPVTLGKSAGGFGRYGLFLGSLTTPGTIVGDQGSGYFNHFGTHTINGTLAINAASTYDALSGFVNATTIDNHGQYIVGGDHVVNAGTFNNAGTLQYQGSTMSGTEIYSYAALNAPLINTGQVNVTGEAGAVIAGAVTNWGTFNIINTDVTYHQPFVNAGAYLSDPSTSMFTDLTINPTGYLQGGVGDVFEIGGDLDNDSQRPSDWQTFDSTLRFTSGSHGWIVAGDDVGASEAGYADNFAWGVLQLNSGAQLHLTDPAGGADGAVYVRTLLLDDGTGQFGQINTGMTIYYDPDQPANAYLQGLTWLLTGGGFAQPIAQPITLGDMNGDGALTHADITPFVQALTAPGDYASAYPGLDPDLLGDFTGDGLLTNGDIDGFVAALAGTATSSIPEPTALALLGLGGLVALGRRRTRPAP